MKILCSIILMSCVWAAAAQQLPVASCGKIIRLSNFESKYVEPRNIDIWLPENYSKNKQYNVLYMHDGQMLFDSATTWNKQAWDVDDIMCNLTKESSVKPTIVVGIWNAGAKRHANYFPQKPYQNLTQQQKDTITKQLEAKGRTTNSNFNPNSDDYLKFIVTELKPYIDSHYSVKTKSQSTFIAGSSMGGLISLYAICEYPNVFGGAACLSTHWPGTFSADNPFPAAYFSYLKQHLPNSKNHKIYFDYGDKTLDSLYLALQKQMDGIMIQKGFTKKHWSTLFFKGKDHSEQSWKERFKIPILFLLKQ